MKTITKITMAAALLACGTAFAQGDLPELKFQDYPSTGGNLLARVAIAKGFCEKHGIKCSLKTIPSAPLGLQVMTADSIDVAMTPLLVEISAVHRGAKVKAIAGAVVDNIGQLVVRNDALGPHADQGFPGAFQDLKGKKIGVTVRGGSSELQLRFLLEKAGLKPDDVTVVAVGGVNTAMPAMMSGQIDAAFSYEPAGSMCEVDKKCKLVYLASREKQPAEIYATNGAQQNMVVKQEMIDRYPERVAAIIGAMTDAQDFIRDPKNFPEVAKISRQFFNLKVPHGEEITDLSVRKAIPGDRVAISRDAVKATVDLMLKLKMIPKPVPVQDLVYDKAP